MFKTGFMCFFCVYNIIPGKFSSGNSGTCWSRKGAVYLIMVYACTFNKLLTKCLSTAEGENSSCFAGWLVYKFYMPFGRNLTMRKLRTLDKQSH